MASGVWLRLSQPPSLVIEGCPGPDVDSVRVILGEQGGILRILIRDRGTGRPIAGAKAIVRDARDAEVFVELNADDHGNFQFAVPHKALVIVAEATGYSAEMFHNGR